MDTTTFENLWQGNDPILLSEGMGMIVRHDQAASEIGVQVAGEENLRWIKLKNVRYDNAFWAIKED